MASLDGEGELTDHDAFFILCRSISCFGARSQEDGFFILIPNRNLSTLILLIG
jgi:hypothetical protein